MYCWHHLSASIFFHVDQYLIKSRFVNETPIASTNTGNFKFVVILKNGICTLRLVYLQRY